MHEYKPIPRDIKRSKITTTPIDITYGSYALYILGPRHKFIHKRFDIKNNDYETSFLFIEILSVNDKTQQNNLPAANSNVTAIATIVRQIISPETVPIIRVERRPISKYQIFFLNMLLLFVHEGYI